MTFGSQNDFSDSPIIGSPTHYNLITQYLRNLEAVQARSAQLREAQGQFLGGGEAVKDDVEDQAQPRASRHDKNRHSNRWSP